MAVEAKTLSPEITEDMKQWTPGNYAVWDTPGQPFPLIQTPLKLLGKADDNFVKAASDMCCIHNCLIRGLNSIYLQARNVAPTKISASTPENIMDVQTRDDFVDYAREWSILLHVHHTGEETHMFPDIDKALNSKDIMEQNVQQHRLFEDGLARYDKYLEQVRRPAKGVERVGEDRFLYGPELCEIIESFGSVLVAHLNEEIGTLLSLKAWDEKLDLLTLMQAEGEKAMKGCSLTGTLEFVWHNLDAEYEDGLHKNFPPAPGLLKFLLKNVLWIPNRRMWKFSTCTSAMKPRAKLLYG